MQIDLKLSGALTLDVVVSLLQSKDDSQHRQVRVSIDGIVTLEDAVLPYDESKVHSIFETYIAGNDYVGPNISANDQHVQFIYNSLLPWPNIRRGMIDH